jgi:competence protein ComEA
MKKIQIFLVTALMLVAVPLSTAWAEVNLNTATDQELQALPGVGPKMSQDIIAARPFKSLEDLKNVKGIGEAKFNKLKGLVSVGEPVAAPTASVKIEHAKESSHKMLSAGEMIDLNSASAQELEKLPGIGAKKAQAIIAARPFSSVEDVMKVKGIKEGIFNKIKNNVTVK